MKTDCEYATYSLGESDTFPGDVSVKVIKNSQGKIKVNITDCFRHITLTSQQLIKFKEVIVFVENQIEKDMKAKKDDERYKLNKRLKKLQEQTEAIEKKLKENTKCVTFTDKKSGENDEVASKKLKCQ